MNISINTTNRDLSGLGASSFAKAMEAETEDTRVSGLDAQPSAFSAQPSAIISSAAIGEADAITPVPDSALSRDDDLGRLVKAALNLPPPPMPRFTT